MIRGYSGSVLVRLLQNACFARPAQSGIFHCLSATVESVLPRHCWRGQSNGITPKRMRLVTRSGCAERLTASCAWRCNCAKATFDYSHASHSRLPNSSKFFSTETRTLAPNLGVAETSYGSTATEIGLYKGPRHDQQKANSVCRHDRGRGDRKSARRRCRLL